MKSVAKAKKKPEKVSDVYYKSYDMHWLRNYPEHPDFHLVAEFDKKKKAQSLALSFSLERGTGVLKT